MIGGASNLGKQMNEMVLVGNELIDFDLNRDGLKKSMFDRNIIYQK